MSFIELPGIEDVQEKKILKEGRYNLVITSNPTARRNEKTGKDNLLVVLAVEGEPDAANILYNLSLPGAQDENEARSFKLLQIKRFCHAFGISLDNGLNTEEFAGCSAKDIMVKQDEYPKDSGQIKNVMNLPYLPYEE